MNLCDDHNQLCIVMVLPALYQKKKKHFQNFKANIFSAEVNVVVYL